MVRENVDVIVCVEATSVGGYNIKNIKSEYLIPALEYYSGTQVSDVNFCRIDQSSTYTLIPFKNAQCFPEPSCRVYGPYTSTKKLVDVFESLDFNGGGGEAYSLGQEGLARAMKVFEKLSTMREINFKSSRHILYLGNSPMYDVPVMECTQFAGKSIDSLCLDIKERHISLSVFSPRKIPYLFKLYETAGGDIIKAKEKNYAKDSRHMILLKNLVLEERPVTPRTSQSPAPGVKQGGTNQAYGFNPNQQMGMQQQYPQNPVGGMNQNPGASKLIPPQPENSTLKGLLNTKPITNQVQPNTGAAWPYGQQQIRGQMQNPRMPVPGGMMQGNTGGMMPGQGMGVVMSTMGGMQGTPSGTGMMPSGGMVQQQPGGVMTNLPGQVGVQGAAGGMMGNQGSQPQAGGARVGPQQQREKQMIWKGELEWQKKGPNPTDQKISYSVSCTVSSNVKENGQPEVMPDNWPSKLMLQLIPKSVIQSIGGQYFKDSKSVLFHPQESDSLEALSKEMSSGFAGCVHISNNGDIKVLILLYGAEKKSYLGFIPNDQNSFVERIMTIIQQQRSGNMRQQQQGIQQQGIQQQPQQQQPQTVNPQGMMNQQPGGMVSMHQNPTIIQQQQQHGMMQQQVSQQQPMSTASGGMMMGAAAGGQQVITSKGSQQGQMVMMTGGNMVRMQGGGGQQQYMRMQQQPVAGVPQQQNRMMQHNPALRQILQQQPGGPRMQMVGGMQPGMQGGMQGARMQGPGGMQGGRMQGPGGMQGGMNPGMQGGMQGMQGMQTMQGMQGMGGGMQGGMMMQNRMRGPGGMMQQQPGQQGGEGSLRDLLSNREV